MKNLPILHLTLLISFQYDLHHNISPEDDDILSCLIYDGLFSRLNAALYGINCTKNFSFIYSKMTKHN